MCYGPESIPPPHGRSGEVAAEEDLTLTSEDGSRFSAHLATAGTPGGAGVVILPDVRGLHSFYCALARSLAQAGMDAIAFDYFGRSAGLTAGREAEFDYQPHLAGLTPPTVAGDARAAAERLRQEARPARLYTLGFCMGGAYSWRQSADQGGLAGCIGFYGRPERVRDAIPRMKAPLLILAAGADQATPVEESRKFSAELSSAGLSSRIVVFQGAPHSFFDRSFDEHRAACAQAWQEIFTFVEAGQ